MGATTCSFTYAPDPAVPATTATISFSAIATAGTFRWGYTVLSDAPVYQQSVFHPPGVNGNIVITNGKTAKRFAVVVIYAGALADCLLAYNDDCEALAGKPFTFTDDNNYEWKRCRIDGMTRERTIGCDIGAFFMAHISFTSHDVGPGTVVPAP